MDNRMKSINSPTPSSEQSKIALVTDWITKTGGGEKVVQAFHDIYPDAPIYTSYCREDWRERLGNKVITGYLQHWPFAPLRRFLPLLRQWWFAGLDLSDYDIVVSITGNGEAKFVRTSLRQTHICYCHTPVHFYWKHYDSYLAHPSMRPHWLARIGLRALAGPLRKRDFQAAQNVGMFIANSTAIQHDIQAYYQKDSVVIHPPINVETFMHIRTRVPKRIIPTKPSCVWWGRVVPAKRLDIAIEACNQLGLPFTIIGDGPDLPRLRQLAGPTVQILGYVSDDDREAHIRAADLYLFPSYEDFGVAPVEALAAGLPLVAYKAGGALDYVQEGINGVFFEEQTVESVVKTLERTSGTIFDTEKITKSTGKFSGERFSQNIQEFVASHTEGPAA